MLIIYSAVSLCFIIGGVLSEFRHIREPVLTIFVMVVLYAFIVTGGVSSLKRKYWRLCFASALLAVLMVIYWSYGLTRFRLPPPSLPPFLAWCLLLLMITGTLPIIFASIRKREWTEISA
jgi:hypothetical protein